MGRRAIKSKRRKRDNDVDELDDSPSIQHTLRDIGSERSESHSRQSESVV